MTLISIIIPVYNEEACLDALYQRLSALRASLAEEYQFEFLFVNDGSRDRSLEILQDLADGDEDVRYLSFSRNFGHEPATTAGMDHAQGEAVVLIDADLQDPPELIVEMLQKWRDGCDVVYARRRRRAGETVFKKCTSWLFYRVLDRLTDITIPQDTGDFRLMDRRVVAAVGLCRENPRFIRGLVSWVGFRQEAVFYDRSERHGGETKYNVIKLMGLTWEAICSFSLIPLQFAVYLGAFVTLASCLLVVIIVCQRVFFQMPFQGYALLACGMFFMGGITLLTLGIMAQYIGHIFRHTQHRPIYIIEQTSSDRGQRRPAVLKDGEASVDVS